jgi:hypothetical protein
MSSDGKHLLVERSDKVVLVRTASGEEVSLGDGERPIWIPGRDSTFLYHVSRGFTSDIHLRSIGGKIDSLIFHGGHVEPTFRTSSTRVFSNYREA